MRKSDGVCKSCNEGLENIEHLFVRCPKVGTFWDNVAECIEKSLHCRIIISLETIVIGLTSDDTNCHMINIIVFICKWELWKRGNKCLFENDIISLEILWKIYKDHIWSYVGSVLKYKKYKKFWYQITCSKLKGLYKSLTGWIMQHTAHTIEFL